jgi:hypothetical protein
LKPSDGKQRIEGRVIGKKRIYGPADGFGPKQRIGAVGLKEKVTVEKRNVVDQDFIGWGRTLSKVVRAFDQSYLREDPSHLSGNDRAVGVDDYLRNGFAAQESPQNVMIKRKACKGSVVLAGHSLAEVSHGQKSNNLHRITPLFSRWL